MQAQVLRLPDVKAVTGLSRSTIYALVKRGAFPSPFRLGPKAIGFLRSEVEAWIEQRAAVRTGARGAA
jgi:prophage regulatory protein